MFGVRSEERVARLEEGVGILRGLWSGGPFSHHGEFWAFEDVEVQPQPVQERVPIVIAVNPGQARDERLRERLERRVARLADGWQTDSIAPQTLHDSWLRMQQYATEQGRTLDTASLHLMVNLDATVEGGRRKALAFLDRYYGVGGVSEEKAANWIASGPPGAVARADLTLHRGRLQPADPSVRRRGPARPARALHRRRPAPAPSGAVMSRLAGVAATVDEALDREFLLETLIELARVPNAVEPGLDTLMEPDHPKLQRYVQQVVRPRLDALGAGELIDAPRNNLVLRAGAGTLDRSILIQGYAVTQHHNLMERPFEPVLRDGRVYAQGVSQTKAHQAVMLDRAQGLVRHRRRPARQAPLVAELRGPQLARVHRGDPRRARRPAAVRGPAARQSAWGSRSAIAAGWTSPWR